MAIKNFADEEILEQNELIEKSSITPSGIQRNEFSSSGIMKRGNDTTDFSTIVDNSLNWDTGYTHSLSVHSPSNAQKNSDITKLEIEDKLTGVILSHAHPDSTEEVEWTHVHCSVNSADITTNILTVPYDTLELNDNTSRYSITNNEFIIGIADRYLFMFTVGIDQIITTSRSEASIWMEADVGDGNGFVELVGTRGYVYSRTKASGHGTFSFQSGFNANVGDKFRIRILRYSGDGVLHSTSESTHMFVMNVPGRGQQGIQGIQGPTGDLGTHEADYDHNAFLSTKADVEGVLTGSISTHTHSDIDLVKQVFYGVVSKSSGTSSIPRDSSVPTISEGTQFMSQTITPKQNTNKIHIQGSIDCGFANGNDDFGIAITVFRGTTNIGTISMWPDRGDWSLPAAINIMDEPNTISAVTYSMRIGVLEPNTTWYVGRGPDNKFGTSTTKNGWSLIELEI